MDITERLKEIILQETNTNIDIRTRKRNTIEIRSLYCTVLKELKPKKTLKSIGETIDLDHSTVIHALKNYKIYEEYNPELKNFKQTILSYFTMDETELKELTDIEKAKHVIHKLTLENYNLKKELKEQIETPRYEFKIIENLNNLLKETKETMQYEIINDRLQAFYRMNKNIRL